MKKLDYISILAGGSCKFNCSFCIGNSLRKEVTPHFSEKYKSFIACFSDQTDLLSVSGDTSDPSFIKESYSIPLEAKYFNPNIKVSVHTRTLKNEDLKRFLHYDKIVISIDENIISNTDVETLLFLQENQKRIRFSIVLTSYNFGYFTKEEGLIEKIVELYPEAQITLRPEVSEAEYIMNCVSNAGTWIEQENGSYYLEENSNIWLWNYKDTNPNINALYLFSDGMISNNCRWDKISKGK